MFFAFGGYFLLADGSVCRTNPEAANGFNDIRYTYVPPVLERRLRPQNVSFAELGERESFRLLDGYLELLSGENRAEPPVILAAQVSVRISELNHAVEPTGALQDRRVQASGVICRGDHDDAILRPHAVEAVE
jgi:hypothetical protein